MQSDSFMIISSTGISVMIRELIFIKV